jgi:hypothetical protein
MKPSESQNSGGDAPSDPWQESAGQQPDRGARQPSIQRVVALAAIIALIVFIVLGLSHSTPGHSTNSGKKTTTSQASKPKSGKSSSKSQPKKNGSSAKSKSPDKTAAGKSSKSGLSNTGPGDTVAVFAAVSAAGVAAHQLYIRRRFSEN